MFFYYNDYKMYNGFSVSQLDFRWHENLMKEKQIFHVGECICPQGWWQDVAGRQQVHESKLSILGMKTYIHVVYIQNVCVWSINPKIFLVAQLIDFYEKHLRYSSSSAM